VCELGHLADMRVKEDHLLSNGMLIVVEWFIHSDGIFYPKNWISQY
jgi:hypothetical protein